MSKKTKKEKVPLHQFYKYNRPPLLDYLSVCFLEEFIKHKNIQEFINHMGFEDQDDNEIHNE